METVLTLAVAAGPIVILIYGAVTLNRAYYLQLVDSTELEENTDVSTKERFLELLKAAEHSMVIYDDGNKMADSIYADPSILGELKKKLDENPSFRLQCLFNFPDPDLPFRKEFSGNPRVEIRTRNSRFPIHYKIFDDGDRAYLSKHAPGESKRQFRVVDCTKVPQKHRKYVRDAILREYKQDFQQAFEAA